MLVVRRRSTIIVRYAPWISEDWFSADKFPFAMMVLIASDSREICSFPPVHALVFVSQKDIDGAEDREASLAFHRTNPQFGEFMDKLLLEIEEYRKGGPDEPELVAAEA